MTRRKKVLLLLAILLVFLLAAPFIYLLVWAHLARTRFDAAVEDLRRRGEPTTLAELAPPPVPDEQNAAVLYEEAFSLYEPFCERLSPETYRAIDNLTRKRQPLSQQELVEVRSILSGSQEILKLVHSGAQRNLCCYHLDYSLPSYELLRKGCPTSRELLGVMGLLRLSARLNLSEAHMDRAVEDCLTLRALARSLHETPGSVALICEEILEDNSYRALMRILSEAEPGPELIHRMLAAIGPYDDRQRLLLGLRSERIEDIDMLRLIANDPHWRQVIGVDGGASGWRRIFGSVGFFTDAYDCQPNVWLSDGLTYIRLMDQAIQLSVKPYYQSASGWKRITQEPPFTRTGFCRPAVRVFIYDNPFAVPGESFDCSVARRAEARLALLLRLYRMKTGHYPDSLSDLIPDFLGKLPLDPFSGKDFVYRRDGAGFVLYSLGPNMVDDAGLQDTATAKDDIVAKSSR